MPRDETRAGLRRTEELFYALVTSPDGVAHAAQARASRGSGDLASTIASDERLSALERLDIYATMYFARLRDVLREDYPKLRAWIGDDAFDELVEGYLRACPPTRPSARDVGENLPDFIDASRWGTNSAALFELARLERALIEAFDGPDSEVLEIESVRKMLPDDLMTLPLSFVPTHVVLGMHHDVDHLWRAIELGSAEGSIGEKQVTVLVWRKDLVSCFRAVDAIEASAFDRVLGGDTFGDFCAWLSEGRSIEEAARLAYELLGRWVTDALITAPSSSQSSRCP